jgi:hypothetical protein
MFHVGCRSSLFKFAGEKVQGVVEELICRRPTFRPGREITLADGRPWTFPAPGGHAVPATRARDDDYLGLLRAVWEAEDLQERYLAELALAIYLIELNYQLSSAELEFLFTYRSGSPELADSQRAFDMLAREHLQSVCPEAILPQPPSSPREPVQKPCARFLVWLRGLGRFRKRLHASRKSEALY